MLLTDAKLYDTAESLIEKIDYLSLGEAQDFLTKMYAAKFLPHTDLDAYPIALLFRIAYFLKTTVFSVMASIIASDSTLMPCSRSILPPP